MQIYDIKEKQKYIEEIAILSHKEWGTPILDKQKYQEKITRKKQQIKDNLNKKDYCKLILLDNKKLIGFISMFPQDGDERKDLSPWYATMYVKKEYRGKGYSKILNDAILKEAKQRGFKKLYLKSALKNYYEKFGAKYIETLNNGEKLYYIETR